MGIQNAMYSGISGLKSNADGMSVIANNIANASTKGFKADRAEFEDLLSVSLGENSQIGRGSRLQQVSTIHTQGALVNTSGITDLGIQGDGFFMVKNENTEKQESGGMFYTRVGAFRFNKEGVLTDGNGSRVQGFMADKQGLISPHLSDIEIPAASIPPSQTSRVTVNLNLDARAVPTQKTFDINNPNGTSNHATTVTVYDGMGRGHVVTVYFSRSPDPEKNLWTWNAVIDGKELTPDKQKKGPDGEVLPVIVAKGQMEFDTDGKIKNNFTDSKGNKTFIDTQGMSDAYEITFDGGAVPQMIQFNFGQHINEDGNLMNGGSTSIATKSQTMFHSQNGYESGQLKTLKFELNGDIRGIYTNGLERRLATVALASFKNNQGIEKAGRNYYIETTKSGSPSVGAPLTGTRGSIFSASLEESNVDLASQFVEMITTQRAFQANSKAITTSDSMLEEVINLKR